MIKLPLIITATLLSLSAYAGLSDDMDSFFNSSGMQSNVTGAGAYKGQTAGLYTGGQVYARNRVKNIQPASMSLPSYAAGCGGIDVFTGSFSYITGDELMQSLKSIGSNSLSYAFMLSMETISPQLSGVQKFLSNMQNVVNQANISSCEAASGLVGGLWPKAQVAQHHICTSAGGSNGAATDWAAAKQECAQNGTTSSLSGSAKKKYDAMITHNKNIAWEAIKANKMSEMDTQMKEVLMSISGTYIVGNGKNDGEDNSIRYKNSLANKDMIKAMMYGGDVSVYKCDETDKCLSPSLATISINKDSSFVSLVSTTISSIRTKIIVGEALEKDEINFLGSTSLPLYKMMNVEYAYGYGSNVLNLDTYSSLIASDMLYQYLYENMEIMSYASESLDLLPELMDKYKKSLDTAINVIIKERNESHNTVNETMNLIKQTQQLEQALAGKLSSQLVDLMGFWNGADL